MSANGKKDLSFTKALTASGASSILDSAFAAYLDKQYPAVTRSQFAIPSRKNVGATSVKQADEPSVYLCGNSLGLMPKNVPNLIQEELAVWATRGVQGHFSHPHDRPWKSIENQVVPTLATIVGARRSEVACMGTLTANLHLLLSSFYKPTKERYKILFEERAFPSDQYAFTSQVQMHGLDPATACRTIAPRDGEFTLRTEDILDIILKEGDEIAIIMFSGVQYYTGQCFEMQKIVEAGHAKGCLVGFDLAHAVGNVMLQLHDWNVDFAAWCSYKYLNAGPGGIAGIFVHQNHGTRSRLSGWWGHNPTTRFAMPPIFDPSEGTSGFQLSNPSVISTISLLGSLQVFQETFSGEAGGQGMLRLRNRSEYLTAYLERLLSTSEYYIPPSQAGQYDGPPVFTIITPSIAAQRGAQLSLMFLPEGVMEGVQQNLSEQGIIGDERQPSVIRFAPVPLYNTFQEVLEAAHGVTSALGKERQRLKT